jgi:hypothetical protein
MTRAFIVSGVLGLGTVLVFGAAMLASALFPNGGTVSTGWNQWGGMEKGIPMPAIERGIVVEPVEPRIDPAVDPVPDGAVEELRNADEQAVDQP